MVNVKSEGKDKKVKVKQESSSASRSSSSKKIALKPGQKYPTPTSGAGDRVFYETLLRQKPDSVMAQEWCLAYGVLPMEEATKLFKELDGFKRKSNGAVSSPARKRKSTGSRKKFIDDVAGDPGMQSGVLETVSSALL